MSWNKSRSANENFSQSAKHFQLHLGGHFSSRKFPAIDESYKTFFWVGSIPGNG
jgi:hypothetical protein